MKYNRRDFLKAMGMLYGSVLLTPACTGVESNCRSLTDREADCLIALCEQIIPRDQDPGATDAGVIHYIDRLLQERFPELKPLYQQGIASLQASCQALYQCHFESLDPDLQIEVMKQMESNKLPEEHWGDIKSAHFFNTVLRHTMQGFYGSPRHGGNKNMVSYRMLKLDYPMVVGQNRYNHG